MGFDQSNYVQTNPDGTYTAVVNGNPVADNNGNTSFKSLDFTQQAFNANSNPAPAPTGGGGGGGTPSYAEQSLQPSSGSSADNNYGNPYGVGATYHDGQWWPASQTGPNAPVPAGYGINPATGLYQGVGTYTPPATSTPAPTAGLVAGLTSTLPKPVTGTFNPNQVVAVVDGQKTLSQIQQILGSQGNPALATQAAATTDPNQLAALYNQTVQSNAAGSSIAQQEAAAQKLQQDQIASNQKQQALTTNQDALTSLVSQLQGPLSPGVLPVINAALSALGLPAIGNSADQAGSGVMPNGITPAMWDQMPDAAKQLILQAWVARGGNVKDFQAGIDAQRPQGSAAANNTFRYAPSPGPVPAGVAA